MKKKSVILALLILTGLLTGCKSSEPTSLNKMVFRMEVKEPINGVCDNSNVVVIIPFPGNGQVAAVCQLKKDELVTKLNTEVTFLGDKPDYEDTGLVRLVINCQGELVQCDTDQKTKSSELDSQILGVFSQLKKWIPGKINGDPLDTVILYRFKIKNGKFALS